LQKFININVWIIKYKKYCVDQSQSRNTGKTIKV
jgi:hypothetical protein